MRRMLDLIYTSALVASAGALVTIAVLVFAQIGGRILDRFLLAMGREVNGILAAPKGGKGDASKQKGRARPH